MYDASDRKSVRAAEKAARLADRNRGEVLIALMGTEPGRRWLWSQLERAHIFTTPFSPDVQQTMFNLGEQNAGLQLLAEIMHWCPDQFIQAMREANGRRTESESKSNNADGAARERSNGAEPGWEPQGHPGESESFAEPRPES